MENVVQVSPLKTAHVNVFVNPSTATTTEIVAVDAGARYRALSVVVTATAAQTVIFKSNTTGISATFSLAAGVPLVLPFNSHGWFETAFGEALQVTTSAATPTAIHVQYIKLAS